MDLSSFLLVLILLLSVIYWFSTKTFNYWKKHNVPSLPDPIPAFGHMLPVITLRENTPTLGLRLYKETDASMIGFYFLRQPALLVRDIELVKSVLQSNFTHFSGNLLILDEKNDPVLAKNPFFVNDPQLWKQTRGRISNHLSNKKLSSLFTIIQQVCSQMCEYTDGKIQQNDGIFECNQKDYFIKYTGEIVANAAFAIQGQSFEDNPDRLSFTNVAKTIFEPTVIHGIKQALLFYLPAIGRFFGVSFLQKSADSYFRENMKAILKERKQAKSAPNDFLQFCLDSNGEDDIDSIIADVITFYADVYETSSTVLSILIYHLSQYKDIQDKLRAHVLSKIQNAGGNITYDAIKEMNYLEQVLYESMRLMAPVGILTKLCSENITLEGFDGLTCKLKPGDPVFISVHGLHRDDNYWQDSLTFDPERFSPENQANREKCLFLGFNEGPRMCVGKRLGVMLVKLAIATLITKYSIEHSPKTKVPLELVPTSFMTHIKGGLWAKFKKL